MIWFTSDTHFDHKNIIKYSKRPYSNVHEMNEALIENWNKKVDEKDVIYHLGDIIFSKDYSVIDRLNGNKIFLRGNHDHNAVVQFLQKKQIAVRDYYELSFKDETLILFHFPIDSWNKARRGSIHLHGHCHGTFNALNKGRRRFDVGVDVYNYAPVSIDQIIDEAKSLPIKDLRDYDDHDK